MTTIIRLSAVLGLFCLGLLLINPTPCYANSPPPPRVVVAVSNAPNDLEIYIGEDKAIRHDRLTQSYFISWPYGQKQTGFTLTATTGGQSLEFPLAVSMTYNNVFSLDLDTGILTSGPPGSRFIWLPITIILTILLEGLVFYSFKYRNRKSWLIFLAINLITQLGLYYWLAQNSSFMDGYIIFMIILGEIGGFIVELVAFVALLREHGRLRAASVAVTSNAFSLFGGTYLLLSLPTGF